MSWKIDFSRDSLKFLEQNNLKDDVIIDKVRLVLRKFKGENMNVDIKKLGGKWEGFYRIRSGKLRIIFEVQFENYRVYIDKVDWRGSAYQ